MSKKSARSKGYRNYKTEQKGFSKGELRTLIISFAVLVLAIAAIIYLPDAIEQSHLVKVKDGAFVNAEDNWLITNISDTSTKKYRKIAEVEAAFGYSLKSCDSYSESDMSRTFTFVADDAETAAAENYVVYGTDADAEETAQSVLDNFTSGYLSAIYGVTVDSVPDAVQTSEVNDKTVYWFDSVYTQEITPEDETTDETTEETADETADTTEETTEAAAADTTAEETAVEATEATTEETTEAAAEETTEAATTEAATTEETTEAATEAATEETTEAAAEETTEEATEETTDETSEEEEETVTQYVKNIFMYMPGDVKGTSVILTVSVDSLTEEELADTDALLELLLNAAAMIN